MISVANDLLNNSPGLCYGPDGRPNSYMDAFADRPMHKCIYLSSQYAYIQIHVYTRCFVSSSSPAVDTCGVPCQLHPCCLIPPSGLLSVGTDRKVSGNSYLLPPRPSVLISLISVSAFLSHSGHFQCLFLFKNPSCHPFPYTALLFLEMRNRAPFDTEVNY